MGVLCVGVGGPVGSGKTALVLRVVPELIARGFEPGIIANDVFTQEDALILRRELAGVLDPERIVGVETGSCPHSAVREDPTANLEAIEALVGRFPQIDIVLIESGGDNLTLTFSPLLADISIYVLDTAAGDKMPRKQGPGMTQADLLVVNKVDLAPYVGADLTTMTSDLQSVRAGPFLFTDCRTELGLPEVMSWLVETVARRSSTTRTGSLARV